MEDIAIPKLTNITISGVCQLPNGTEMKVIHKDKFIVAMYYISKNKVSYDFPMSNVLTTYERQEIEQYCTYDYKYFVRGYPVRMQFNLPEDNKLYEADLNTVMEKIYRASGLNEEDWNPTFTRGERLLIWRAMYEITERMKNEKI